ncbi:MAG: hypothetical protein JWQ00_1638 [Noviherbaspirillum sp.]|jgi:hypothetical protein|nr:hypothetical protein [Noviherbaspirillum sp.]
MAKENRTPPLSGRPAAIPFGEMKHVALRGSGRHHQLPCDAQGEARSNISAEGADNARRDTWSISKPRRFNRASALLVSAAVTLSLLTPNAQACNTCVRTGLTSAGVGFGFLSVGGALARRSVAVAAPEFVAFVDFVGLGVIGVGLLLAGGGALVNEITEEPTTTQPDPPPQLSNLSSVTVDPNTGQLIPTMTTTQALPPGSVVAIIGNDFNRNRSRNLVFFGTTLVPVDDLLELGDGVQALLVSVPLLKKPDASSPLSQPEDVSITVINNRQRSNLLPFRVDKLVDAGPPGQVTLTAMANLKQMTSRFIAADWKKITEVEARSEGIQPDEFERAAIADIVEQLTNTGQSVNRKIDQMIQMPPNEDLRVIDSLIAASLVEELTDVALKMPLEPVATGGEPRGKPRHHKPYSRPDGALKSENSALSLPREPSPVPPTTGPTLPPTKVPPTTVPAPRPELVWPF